MLMTVHCGSSHCASASLPGLQNSAAAMKWWQSLPSCRILRPRTVFTENVQGWGGASVGTSLLFKLKDTSSLPRKLRNRSAVGVPLQGRLRAEPLGLADLLSKLQANEDSVVWV